MTPPNPGRGISIFLLVFPAALLPPLCSAQSQARTSSSHATRLTCPEALQLLVAESDGSAADTALFQVTSRGAADEVLRRLTDLALGRPRCAAATGVRGLFKLRLDGTGWVPKDAPGQKAGIHWKEGAIYDLADAAKAGESAGAAAAISAGRILLTEPVDRPYLVREVGPALVRALAVGSQLADTLQQFQRGRLAAWLGLMTIADSAFSSYAGSGGSRERAALELARVRLSLGRTGADSLYYAAAASPDPTIAKGLRADMALVADSAELAAYDRVIADRRAAWLKRFWEDRDLESVRPRGTRLREHYRRIGIARQRFRLMTYPRHYELNELWRNRTAEYDDRGLVFIRHGPPDRTAEAVRAGTCPNSSWLYRRSEGNLIFHFVARQNPDDWRLVETLANVGGGRGATTRLQQSGSSRSCRPIDGLFDSRSTLDPIYGQLAVNQSRINWERELIITTRSRLVGTTTDSDLPRFPRTLDVLWRAYGLLGAAPGQGRALVLVSVPASFLSPISREPLAYGFGMRLTARSGARAVEIDTVRLLSAPRAPGPGQMLTFTQEVRLAAGRWSIGVSLVQPKDSAGQVLRDADVAVPNSARSALALSDIVLGESSGGRPWSAPDGPFPLSPTGHYPRGRPVPIYYEIAGAAGGGTIETEITLAGEKGKDRSVIRFRERAADPVQRVRRELSTSRSRPGRYTLTVTVRTPDGRQARREASLSVIEQ